MDKKQKQRSYMVGNLHRFCLFNLSNFSLCCIERINILSMDVLSNFLNSIKGLGCHFMIKI